MCVRDLRDGRGHESCLRASPLLLATWIHLLDGHRDGPWYSLARGSDGRRVRLVTTCGHVGQSDQATSAGCPIIGSWALAHSPALSQDRVPSTGPVYHLSHRPGRPVQDFHPTSPGAPDRTSGPHVGLLFYMGLVGWRVPGSGDPFPGAAPWSRRTQEAPTRAPCGRRFPLSPSHHAARARSSHSSPLTYIV